MKIFNLPLLYLVSIFAVFNTAHAQKTNSSLTIGDKKLTLQLHTKCPKPRPSREELAKYLAQYDPKQEEGFSTYDEDRPFTQKDIKEMRDYLVKDGFRYPNGQESMITWMDFDGDGICDFTASAGIGGSKSIDRMFLFRGLANGKFKLVDSYLDYMSLDILAVPYIPIHVSGEKLPILFKGRGELMQWQSKDKKFALCEESSVITERKKHLEKENKKPQTLMDELCPHEWKIYQWTENQLPNKNEVSHTYIDSEK